MIFSISITYTTYQSLKGQLFLLRDFNNNQFSVTMDKIDHITLIAKYYRNYYTDEVDQSTLLF